MMSVTKINRRISQPVRGNSVGYCQQLSAQAEIKPKSKEYDALKASFGNCYLSCKVIPKEPDDENMKECENFYVGSLILSKWIEEQEEQRKLTEEAIEHDRLKLFKNPGSNFSIPECETEYEIKLIRLYESVDKLTNLYKNKDTGIEIEFLNLIVFEFSLCKLSLEQQNEVIVKCSSFNRDDRKSLNKAIGLSRQKTEPMISMIDILLSSVGEIEYSKVVQAQEGAENELKKIEFPVIIDTKSLMPKVRKALVAHGNESYDLYKNVTLLPIKRDFNMLAFNDDTFKFKTIEQIRGSFNLFTEKQLFDDLVEQLKSLSYGSCCVAQEHVMTELARSEFFNSDSYSKTEHAVKKILMILRLKCIEFGFEENEIGYYSIKSKKVRRNKKVFFNIEDLTDCKYLDYRVVPLMINAFIKVNAKLFSNTDGRYNKLVIFFELYRLSRDYFPDYALFMDSVAEAEPFLIEVKPYFKLNLLIKKHSMYLVGLGKYQAQEGEESYTKGVEEHFNFKDLIASVIYFASVSKDDCDKDTAKSINEFIKLLAVSSIESTRSAITCAYYRNKLDTEGLQVSTSNFLDYAKNYHTNCISNFLAIESCVSIRFNQFKTLSSQKLRNLEAEVDEVRYFRFIMSSFANDRLPIFINLWVKVKKADAIDNDEFSIIGVEQYSAELDYNKAYTEDELPVLCCRYENNKPIYEDPMAIYSKVQFQQALPYTFLRLAEVANSGDFSSKYNTDATYKENFNNCLFQADLFIRILSQDNYRIIMNAIKLRPSMMLISLKAAMNIIDVCPSDNIFVTIKKLKKKETEVINEADNKVEVLTQFNAEVKKAQDEYIEILRKYTGLEGGLSGSLQEIINSFAVKCLTIKVKKIEVLAKALGVDERKLLLELKEECQAIMQSLDKTKEADNIKIVAELIITLDEMIAANEKQLEDGMKLQGGAGKQ